MYSKCLQNWKAILITTVGVLFAFAMIATSYAGDQKATSAGLVSGPSAGLISARTAMTDSRNIWRLIASELSLDPELDQKAVQRELKRYRKNIRYVELMLTRAEPYIYYIYVQLKRRNMPIDFALLPMVESSFNPRAYSHAGATGLWQMMPGTASSYGLDINWWYDQRRDIQTSTNAALNYLDRLKKWLGSWEYAAAAYNAGGGTVKAAIKFNKRNGASTSYWHLPLPKETRGYLPKLLALAEILRNPERYGLKLPDTPVRPYFSSLELKSQLDIGEIAKFANMSVEDVQKLNPGLRRWSASPDGKYTLLLPTAKAYLFTQNLQRSSGKTRRSWQFHEVRTKENLKAIAKNYHTSVALLQKINGLKSKRVHVGQGLLVPVNLNHRYQAVVAMNTDYLPSSPWKRFGQQLASNAGAAGQPATLENLSAADLLAGKGLYLLAKNKPNVDMRNKSLAARKTKPTTSSSSEPLHENDTLKTLLSKIYGS